MIYIGKIIREKLNEQNRTVVWFAKKMSCSRTKAYDIFGKYSLDSNELLHISLVLEYNFFCEYDKEYDSKIKKRAKDS